jgi:hypothetical protein
MSHLIMKVITWVSEIMGGIRENKDNHNHEFTNNLLFLGGAALVGCAILGGAFVLGLAWRNADLYTDRQNIYSQVVGDIVRDWSSVENKAQLLEGLFVRK